MAVLASLDLVRDFHQGRLLEQPALGRLRRRAYDGLVEAGQRRKTLAYSGRWVGRTAKRVFGGGFRRFAVAARASEGALVDPSDDVSFGISNQAALA
jgi:hypothetical protein